MPISITARIGVLLTASVALLLALTTTPAAAQVSTNAAVFEQIDGGYEGVYDGRAAGRLLFSYVDGAQVHAYCLDPAAELNRDTSYTPVSWADATAPNPGLAAAVGAAAPDVGTPLEDLHAEQTAVQVAVWQVANDITFTYDDIPNQDILDRAAEIAAADVTAVPEPTVDIDLDVATSRDGTAITVSVLASTGGLPLATSPLTITAGTDEITVTTDEAGQAVVTFDAPDAGTVTVTAPLELGPGTVLRPSLGGQDVVTIQGHTVEISATSDFDAAPTPEPTPTPTPEPTLEPTPEPTPVPTVEPPVQTPVPAQPAAPSAAPVAQEQLPFTGPGMLVALVAGGGVAATGGAAWLRRVARK